MGSRVMHFCITNELNKQLYSSNEIRLHLGGLAPDLTHPVYAPKHTTHFVQINSEGKKRIDCRGFIQTYKPHFDDPFFTGYLSHLVADNLWYETMYLKLIKPLPEYERTSAVEKGYRDFHRLNSRLLAHYALTPLEQIPAIDDVTIEGLYPEYIPFIAQQLNDDFKVEEEVTSAALEIYDVQQILAYIGNSVTETVRLLEEMKGEPL
ncbi:hypothetical protein [Paenibacillus sp. NEAU-GSW1]|uniref:hypothetical protein n=1 Tax=Paenibacillus sp. NEAU-GSW1 TaxID=2682486 RepID=UPI0012E1E255|nr:hypothetical protein [Paenibacillus sp. NEAU-GSW1]MUT68108.1 hypothetical protein [Paenibacillus sp. NEAU-GSW1]